METNNENKSLEELKEELEQAKKAYELIQQFYDKKEKAEAEERKVKLAQEKEARRQEVADAEKQYRKLLAAYIKDYGSYSNTRTYESDSTNNQERDFPYLWHWFY